MRNELSPAAGLASADIDRIHASRAWAFAQAAMQSRELVASSLGQNFHAAVVIVAHPPGDAQDVRLALHKPAEADALHASANAEPAGSDGLFSGSHKKLLIVDF